MTPSRLLLRCCLVPLAAFSEGMAQAVPDYTVTVPSSGVSLFADLIVSGGTAQGGALQITQPADFAIEFSSPGRTFSVNGGPLLNGSSGALGLGGVGSVTVNGGPGSDAITLGTFHTPVRSLTINGGRGDDTVTFSGSMEVGADGLNVDLQNDDLAPGNDRVVIGAGARVRGSVAANVITIRCSGGVSVEPGAILETAGAPMIIEANAGGTQTGTFTGVDVNGGTLRGSVAMVGRGGSGATGSVPGIWFRNGASVTGSVSLAGSGGSSASGENPGILVTGASRLECGFCTMTGTGGTSEAEGGCAGIAVREGSTIQINGSGPAPRGLEDGAGSGFEDAHLTGTGGNRTGEAAASRQRNSGIWLDGPGTAISVTWRGLYVSGASGSGTPAGLDGSWGIRLSGGAQIDSNGSAISLGCGSFDIDNTSQILSGANSQPSQSRVVSLGSGSAIMDLGGADSLDPPTLGLTDAEVDRIQCNYLSLGGARQRITAPMTPVPRNLWFSNLEPVFPGVDVTLAPDGSVWVGALRMDIHGPQAGTDYSPLTVAGGSVAVGSVTFAPSFTAMAGESFVVVEQVDPRPPLRGIWQLAGGAYRVVDGDYAAWPAAPGLVGRWSFTSGTDANDLAISLVAHSADFLRITSGAAGGPGSLTNAVSYANAHAGPDTIIAGAQLSGQTIAPGVGLTLADITLEASALSVNADIETKGTTSLRGVTISGGQAGSLTNFGDLTMTRCSVAACRGISSYGANLTLTDCSIHDNGDQGGLFIEAGNVSLLRCTLENNRNGSYGGGLICGDGSNAPLSMVSLDRCTITGNTALIAGGILNRNATLHLTHCTVAANVSLFGTSPILPTADEDAAPPPNTLDFCLVGVDSLLAAGDDPVPIAFHGVGNVITVEALAPPSWNGGPTRTMALPPGHPARAAAAGSSAVSDQRGFPVIGVPDAGAYEAGTFTNFPAWIGEMLPASAEHAPGADADSDGATNEAEWASLTDPGDPTSVFRVRAELADGQLTLRFDSMPGRHYTLWASSDPGAGWAQSSETTIEGDGSPRVFLMPLPQPGSPLRRFYRVQSALP